MGGLRSATGGAWSQHLGRATFTVPGGADWIVRVAGDGHALNRIALPHLDEQASALSARAPKWVLPPTHGDLRAGFVALVSVDQQQRPPKVLLRSEPVPETVPTRVMVDLDLVDGGFRTEVVARWDVGVLLPVPGVAARVLQPLLGHAVERLVRDVAGGLADAAAELAEAADAPAPSGRPAPRPDDAPGPVPMPRLRTRVPGPVGPLAPDDDLDALLAQVIDLS